LNSGNNLFTRNDPILKQRRRELRRDQADAERKIWQHLRNRQINGKRFHRQYSAGPYILDFYFPKLKLSIEIDGGQHSSPDNKAYDVARTAFLNAMGIVEIRFWNHEVLGETNSVIARIAEIITPPAPLLPQEGEEIAE
jgi:very-short-patch-repair endonuclease